METLQELYKLETSRKLLTFILNSEISLKFSDNRYATDTEKIIVEDKMKILIENDQYSILLRGVTKSTVRKRLISKLNSDDSLYDGLFLVGDKAKNFLEKSENIPHPIKIISSNDNKTAAWIFETYSNLTKGPIDLNFFKDNKNKKMFIENIKGNEELIDYYLFGLHTDNSDRLVNFVSTTLSPEIAFYNQPSDKLVIVLWLPKNYTLYMNSERLKELNSKVTIKNLPVLSDSFYPTENEFSFKGFILPHIIIGVHDLDTNEFILNPALLIEKTNWLQEGFDIDQSNFELFIKQTKYKRFLILTDKLEEKNVC